MPGGEEPERGRSVHGRGGRIVLNPSRATARSAAILIALTLLGAACASDGASPPTSTSSSPRPTTPPTTILPGPPPGHGVFVPGEGGAALLDGPGGAQIDRIRGGVVLPYASMADGHAEVLTPCGNDAWVDLSAGTASGPYRVVIDPGHGGDEPGAVGPGGLTEKEVNLDIAERVVEFLAARGIPTVLTRTSDYRITLRTRVRVAVDAESEVFVSVHHNAEPDEQRDTPGAEAYYQYRSDASKRLTGLLYEEVFETFDAHDISFGADFDAGAKYRLSGDGRDYYGVIRRSFEADVAATLLEGAFISNPEEEALLRRPDVRQREAEAIAQGIVRYFEGDEPGDVFTEPYPRTTPAGSGGGPEGCVEPS